MIPMPAANRSSVQVTFNPKDTSTFASASLDRTVKVWSIGQPAPNFTLEGHEKGVNAVDYFTGGDRPYLISGADDKTAKVSTGIPLNADVHSAITHSSRCCPLACATRYACSQRVVPQNAR